MGIIRVRIVSVFAAAVLAVLLNYLGARHYKRWDVTSNKRYTLTPATLETLRTLPERTEVWVLLGSADPLFQSVKQLLVAYAAESPKLDIHYVDPDRDTLSLEDVRKRFRIETGRTSDGRVVTDAIMVIARGEKYWFLAPTDMVEVSDADDARAKPKEEQAITSAIRQVHGGEKAKLCFTSGHGELSLAESGDQGLATFAGLLEKDNYETVTIDTTLPNAVEPFKGCAAVILAGPRAPFSKEEEARLKVYLLAGGNLLAGISPINGASEEGMTDPHLAEALAPFGIALEEDLVFELDPAHAIPEARGIRFLAEAKEHPVTAALVRTDAQRDAPRVLLHFARSLRAVTGEGSANATPVLVSSDKSFGITSIHGAAQWTDIPEKKGQDKSGPLYLAMASERPKVSPSAAHGPRVVVVGTGSIFAEHNWREAVPLRGTAFMVENALSWLVSRPIILDVPAKASVPAGIRMTDESRAEVQRYVLAYMPMAFALLGIAIALRRRSTEGEPRSRKHGEGANKSNEKGAS